jgi:hypothetical protein
VIEIVRAKKEDINAEVADLICGFLLPAFKRSKIGTECSAFAFEHFWKGVIEGTPPAALFLLKDGNEILGLIGGLTFRDPLTNLLYGAEVVWRVKGGGHGWGIKLLQAFEWWAASEGCSRIVLHGSFKELHSLDSKISPLGYNRYQVEWMKEI